MRDRLPLILSTTALLVALFGATPLGEAAYNAVVPRNSVGAAQLRKGAVTNVKLRGDAVTSGKVKNHSLKAIDFQQGQLPAGAQGPQGPQGAKGDKGDKGSKGDKGDPGLSGYEIVRKSVNIPPNTSSTAQAACPPGKKVLGGAANIQGVPANAGTIYTQTTLDRFYDALYTNTSTTQTRQLNAIAICATVAP
jgi:hypothetical protein